MLPFKKIYAVEYYEELQNEFKKNFNKKNIICIKNNGTDFPGINDGSIDFIWSFGVFVHLEVNIIEEYLYNMKRIMKKGAVASIQYSDKTKEAAIHNIGFSQNNPKMMRECVKKLDYKIIKEDINTLPHSSVIVISKEY